MKIQVMGLGKLGLPLAVLLAKHYDVYGVDINKDYIRKIKEGLCPIEEPKVVDILKYSTLKVGLKCKKADITFVIVPTPSMPDGRFSNEYIDQALSRIGKGTVAIISTVMPGTCEKRNTSKLHIIYNPVFIALGSVIWDLENPDFILTGAKKPFKHILSPIWQKVCSKTPFCVNTGLLEAEIAKLSLNCYLTMKITFANHLQEICEGMVDVETITRAIGHDSRIGKKYLNPGLGYGGPCFPRDNRAFQAFAKSLGKQAEMAELVDRINKRQVCRMIEKIKALKPKTIGFKSLSYKEGTNITEDSQLLMIYNILKDDGYNVKIGKGDVTLDHGGIV